MIIIICFALAWAPLNLLFAQKISFLTIKGGVISAFNQNYTIALEWKPRPNLCFELSSGFHHYNRIPEGAINGLYKHEYALRRMFSSEWGAVNPQNDTGWEYFGTGRPIPSTVQGGLTPLFTWRMSLGFRMDYPTRLKHVNFFFQPSISMALHRKLEATDPSPILKKETNDEWSIIEPEQTRVFIQTKYFFQQQKILIKNTWFPGPAAILGWSWHAPKGFVIEARGNIGVNFGKVAQAEKGYLTELAPLYGQIDLMVGYCFGGKTLGGKATL